MKKWSIFIFIGICFLTACGERQDSSNQEIPPADTSNAAPMGTNNDQMTREPETAAEHGQMNEGTGQDSAKRQANPNYKGDNSDTGNRRR